jgi:hypothetical protein
MPTRNAIAVAKAHIASKEKWTVNKVLKMQITLGTALYMVWSADDQKHYPPKSDVGNVRIGLLQSVTGGVHIVFFKDNTVRKVRASDVTKVIEISNGIYSSGLLVHRNNKILANQEVMHNEDNLEDDVSGGEEGEEEGSSESDNEEVRADAMASMNDGRYVTANVVKGLVTTVPTTVAETLVATSAAIKQIASEV